MLNADALGAPSDDFFVGMPTDLAERLAGGNHAVAQLGTTIPHHGGRCWI